VAALLIAAYFVHGSSAKPTIQSTAAKKAPATATVKQVNYHGLPVRLKIPAINVDAPVEYMGNTPAADMAAPNDVASVGWYKYGSIPGEEGGSVIDGHVVGLRGEAGVFYQLDKLKKGDVLSVIDAKGQTAMFTVRETKTYDQSQQPTEVFNSSGGKHLNLITCSGDWDADHRQYLKRFVVFADITP
jgi:sortase A